MTRGTIEHLRPGHAGGHGFGVIAPDDGGRPVYFYQSSVEGHLFNQLRVGQRTPGSDSEGRQNLSTTSAEQEPSGLRAVQFAAHEAMWAAVEERSRN